MEPGSFLQPETYVSPGLDESNPHPHPICLKHILILTSHLPLGLPRALFTV